MDSTTSAPISVWIVFHLLVVFALLVDLFWLHRKPHGVSTRESLAWAGFWVVVAACLNTYIYWQFGAPKAVDFTTGYLLELTLSMDNVFVFYLIFRAFHIVKIYQHKILFWGILGAFVMRGLMIVGGIELLHHVHWASYVLGAILVLSGLKILREKSSTSEDENEQPLAIRLIKRWLPIKDQGEAGHFFIRDKFRWHATPMFVALISVEFADLVFALDSVPAVLAITSDFFIVYTSNILAILGLRAMYEILSKGADFLPYLHKGLALVLVFVGSKFVLSSVITVPTLWSLGVIVSILGVSVVASLVIKKDH